MEPSDAIRTRLNPNDISLTYNFRRRKKKSTLPADAAFAIANAANL